MAGYTFLFDGKTWYLELDTLERLNTYMDVAWAARREEVLEDLGHPAGQHGTSDIAAACSVMAAAKGTDVFTEYRELKRTQHEAMSRMILSGKTLYVNPAGGYKASIGKAQSFYNTDSLKWPAFCDQDIRIRKWPGGVHYYAYIGPVQVKDGDTVKWDSESDARSAARAYMAKKRKFK